MCGSLIEGSTVIPAELSRWSSPLFGADVPGHGISSAPGDMNLEREESEPCGAASVPDARTPSNSVVFGS